MATERKSTHVVMVGNSRGAKDGDVLAVTPPQAETLIREGLARAPRSGEVKAATEK